MSKNSLGQIYAISAFLFWGLTPIYFKQIATVQPLEILANRIVWSVVVLFLILLASKGFLTLKEILKDFSKVKYLIISSILISTNWLIFIWAISNNMIVEASLGYFINPLIVVALGYIFFQERMSKYQNLAIILALCGVLYQLITLGTIPFVSLILAFSFALYGLVRKKINMPSVPSLFIETILVSPFALAYMLYLSFTNESAFITQNSYISIMLFLAGIITVLPLLMFNGAATRMKLTTLGFFQYIGPSVSFLIGVFLYNEDMNVDKLITFIFIWLALFIFSFDSIRRKKA